MSTAILPAESTEAKPGAEPTRDPYFDNAKLLAVVLVVWGHTWGPLVGDPSQHRALRTAYLLVYSFHMPLFIMISGWFSRSFAKNASHPGRLQRLLTSTLVPYLIFASAYTLFRNYGKHHWTPMQLLNPWYLTWFLVALFVWRVTAPVWRIVRWPVAVAVAVMLAAGATEVSGDLALGQVLQFLPFFVIGLTSPPALLDRVRGSRMLRGAAVPVFAAAYALLYWYGPRLRTEWLYHRSGHQRLDVSMVHWAVETLLLNGVALVLCLAFLALVPRGRNHFTTLGTGSQYTYLLHGFLVQGALMWGGYKLHLWATWSGQLLLTAIAAAVALLLATSPVRRALRWAAEPELRWVFRQ